MIQESKMVYAKNSDGMTVHIDDVPRGDACKCFCLDENCNSPLIAKKGEVNIHHFAHKNPSLECRACSSNESALHFAAKNIVKTESKLIAPFYENRKLVCETLYLVDTKCEVTFGDKFRSDVTGFTREGEVIDIEIMVTSPCSDDKINALRALNRSSIQIDLSDIPRVLEIEELKQMVLYTAPREWLHSKDYSELDEYQAQTLDVIIYGSSTGPRYSAIKILHSAITKSLLPYEAADYLIDQKGSLSGGQYRNGSKYVEARGNRVHNLGIPKKVYDKIEREVSEYPFRADVRYKLLNDISGKTQILVLDINKSKKRLPNRIYK
ncbi:hypothetical protein L1267_16930 [Pseudoalteromonas sp. OFAV1]|uniref:competence protein CoiA family protein n=1 Tax=Pseudoalteromonas sp. OFAV1 TaxID=2908892 RepID=UPI001F25BD08|nr:competence protein CoiA family protein [Pseudoalteromonas sp. OFAV1]MCF2902062.1 hypothetical protein [Pseudoalteromonas sp. OFAV1]